jgi:hypothetical protein
MNFPENFNADCLRCAQASADAYSLEGQSGIEQIILQDTATDTQGIIRVFPDVVIVALRGTTNLHDWQTDAKIRREDGVHRGFLTSARAILWQILDSLRSPAIREFPVLVTGHSLGGALAVLVAEELLYKGVPMRSVYTFGQPRVFNAQRCDQYTRVLGSRTFRLVNHRDPVPRLPGPLIGYRHAGRELLWRNGQLSVDPSTWSKVGWALAEGFSAFGYGANWIGLTRAIASAAQIAGDHAMADYLSIATQLYFSQSANGGDAALCGAGVAPTENPIGKTL